MHPSPPLSPLRQHPIRILLALTVVLCGITSHLLAQTTQHTVQSQSAPDRNHRLFFGVNIKILLKGNFSTVLDYSQSFVELEGSSSDRIDVRTVNQARSEGITKVGRNPLTVTAIKSFRDYSRLADSGRRWAAQRSAMQSFHRDEQGKLIGNLKDPHGATRTRPSRTNTFYNPISSVDDRASEALDAEIQAQLDSEFYADDGQSESDEKSALVVTAQVSSPDYVAGAYAVAVARVRIKGELKDLFLFSDLAPLGPEPQQIQIRKEKLPLDLHVITVDLHLFREGHEFVTSLSPNQFPLTRDEAAQYLSLAHTSNHRGKTLSAQPAWNLAPPELFAADSPDSFDFPVRVSVNEQGHVTAIQDNIILPDPVRAVVNNTLFLPALDDGVPIPSETTFNLRDFFR